MENNKVAFLDQIIFEKQILNIKNKKFQRYFLSLFKMKNVILKLVFFLILAILVFTTCFGIRQYFISFNPNEVVLNSGIAFSQFANANSFIVYFIQSIPVVVAILAILLIPNPYICIGIMMLLFGGLVNIIDRSLGGTILIHGTIYNLKDSVVDYIPVGATKANLPDIFIIIGACLAVFSILINIFKNIKNDDAML